MRLQLGLESNAEKHGIPSTINRVGSMVCPFFTDTHVINYETAKLSDLERFKAYFAGMLQEGVSVAPSQFEGMFLSGVHTEADIDRTIEAHDRVLASL